MKLPFQLILVLMAAACLLLCRAADAEDKKQPEAEKKKEPAKGLVVESELIDVDLKDKVTQNYSKVFTFKMEKDKTYQIDLKGNNFLPFIRLEDAKGTQVETGGSVQFGQPASILYKATKTEEFQITVTSALGQPGMGKFTLTVRDGAATIVLQKTEKLNQNDPVYQMKKHKLFVVEFEAGKTYQIDMRSNDFDSYLYLESPGMKVLAFDDDSGGFPNARIIHKATETGKFRVIATHFGNGGALGEFNLTVRLTDAPAPVQDKKRPKKLIP